MSSSFDTRNGTTGTAQDRETLKDSIRGLKLADRLHGAKTGAASSTWLPWLLCILLAIAWAGVGFRWYRASGNMPNANAVPQQITAAPASASPAQGPETKPGELVLERKGYIIAAHQISISPIGVEGRIIDLNIVEGKQFQEGDVLATLDDTTYRAQYEEALAQEAATMARYSESKTNLQYEIAQAESEEAQSKAQLEEARLLYENAKRTIGATSKEDSDQKEKKYSAAVANLKVQAAKLAQVKGESRIKRTEALHADWVAAQARAKTAKWKLDNCKIKAPVTGIILSKKAEIGNLINPVVGGVSTSLCEMANLSELEVELEVEERDVAKVATGMRCTIRMDAYPNRGYEGYVHRIMPMANRGKGILPVRVKILFPVGEQQGYYLKPEMNSLVSIYNDQSTHWFVATFLAGLLGNGGSQ